MRKISFLGLFCIGLMMTTFADVPPTILPKGFERHIANIESYAAQAKNVQDFSYRLDSRIATGEYETSYFYYDAQNRLICATITSDLDTKDSLFYDENNNLIRFDGWQNLGIEWMHTYYVEYTYDANGNRLTRTNYNNFNQSGESDWNLGGIYEYTYNENNQVVSHEMYLGGEDFLYEICDYTYNEAGQLIEQLFQNDDFYGGFVNSGKIEYVYDEAGRLSQVTSYYDDYGTWAFTNLQEYIYDEDGNCSEMNAKDEYGEYVDRHLYEFNPNIPYSQVLLPTAHPELGVIEFYAGDAHPRTVDHWYTMDMDQGTLTFVYDYNYNYTNLVGIQDYATESDFQVYPNPTTGNVHFDGNAFQSPVQQVSVWDIQGRQVGANTYQDSYTVDFNGLQSGIYVLRVECVDGSSHFSKVVKE